MSTDDLMFRPVQWFTLGDDGDPDADVAAFDPEIGKVFCDYDLAGDGAAVAREASRRKVAVLHRRGRRYGPAEWIGDRPSADVRRVEWIVAEVLAIVAEDAVEDRYAV